MLNKKNLIKLSLGVMAVGMMGVPLFSSAQYSIPTQALNFVLKKISINEANISPIHFRDNENNFGGFIYFSNTFSGSTYQTEGGGEEKKTESIEVSDGTGYECKDQVKGFYYDSQRGERLWPLDKDTKKAFGMDNLTLSGGMYTNCVQTGYDQALENCAGREDSDTCKKDVNEQYSDGNGYYGHIYHKYGEKEYNLIAGVNYKTGVDRVNINSDAGLAPTFIRYNNQTPLGLIYDTNGGVGFVGCYVESGLNILVEKLMGGSKLAGLFTLENDVIKSNMGKGERFHCDMAGTVKDFFRLIIEGVVGMSTDTDAGQTKDQRRNNPSDKTQLFDSSSVNNATLINYTKQKAESLCRGKWNNCSNNNCNDKIVCIDASTTINASDHIYKGKTLIVKKGNVIVSRLDNSNDVTRYDIFIDGGNLLIEETSQSGNIVIGKNGFMTGMNVDEFNQKFNKINGIGVASVLRGNFIVNGEVKKYNIENSNENNKLTNKYFIYGKLTSLDTVDTLEKKFVWYCDYEAMGSDGYACPISKYQGAFLSVIDQNYPSPLQ